MSEWEPISKRIQKIIRSVEAFQEAIELIAQQEIKKAENMVKTLKTIEEREQKDGKRQERVGRDTDNSRPIGN